MLNSASLLPIPSNDNHSCHLTQNLHFDMSQGFRTSSTVLDSYHRIFLSKNLTTLKQRLFFVSSFADTLAIRLKAEAIKGNLGGTRLVTFNFQSQQSFLN
eukprot:GFUD01061342.1.p1 GENE.GFUD01061342.1~~GFUD01061342.1.p1  ORF type:complete len:100 (+),score=2.40 GFUD01061342.1:300-599(+)